LIFKYHYQYTAWCKWHNQNQRKLAEQIKKSKIMLKQHLSPKEHERLEWNGWFSSMKWADGKQVDLNHDPEAHII
jgi:hypothetical protein